jgi:hypothetical protein
MALGYALIALELLRMVTETNKPFDYGQDDRTIFKKYSTR